MFENQQLLVPRTHTIKGQGYKVTVEQYDECFPLWEMLVELEKHILFETLRICKGVKAQAAERLMLNRTTVVEKARKYGYVKPGEEE